MTRKTRRLRELVKDYFIPHLSVEHDGKKIPVVTIWQSDYEWRCEYERAEFWRKVSIAELLTALLLMFSISRKRGYQRE